MSDTMEDPATQEEPVDPWAEPRTTAGGSAETGWIVDVHDGNRHEVYRVEGADEAAASAAALDLFNAPPPPEEDPLVKALAAFKKDGDKAVSAFVTKGDKAISDFQEKADAALDAHKKPAQSEPKHDTKHDDKRK
jgi:hypothetical protein